MPDLSGPLTRRNYGNNHGYKFGDIKVPGVTTVIGIRDRSALKSWAAGCAAVVIADNTRVVDGRLVIDGDQVWADLRALDEKMAAKPSRSGLEGALKWVHTKMGDKAANKGTAVHKLAEQMTNGETVDVPPELVGHVDAYLAWWKDWAPTDTISEFQVGSRRHGGWAGTGDLLCTIDKGWRTDDGATGPPLGRTMVDIKTSASGVYGDTALQLAGYRFADIILLDGEEHPMEPVDSCAVLWLRSDGFTFFPFRVGPLEERLFLYCRAVYALWQEPWREGWQGDSKDKPKYADMAWGDTVKGAPIFPADAR